jgi:hypothetical protein
MPNTTILLDNSWARVFHWNPPFMLLALAIVMIAEVVVILTYIVD